MTEPLRKVILPEPVTGTVELSAVTDQVAEGIGRVAANGTGGEVIPLITDPEVEVFDRNDNMPPPTFNRTRWRTSDDVLLKQKTGKTRQIW